MLRHILHIKIILFIRILNHILEILSRKVQNIEKIGILNKIPKHIMNLLNKYLKVHILRMHVLICAKKLSK